MSTVVNFEESTCDSPVHILNEVLAIEAEMVSNRRWFHAHPELGFEEVKTAAKIAEILKSYGISKVWEGVGRTGVVAFIEGGSSGPCVGLRADMDGLPITETAKIDYISTHPGVMHACGHDGHISALLGAAKILNAQKSAMKGSIKLLFQPAEEGGGGARFMIEDGVLEEGKFGPRVDFVYGIHLWSVLPLGKIGCKLGPIMAASDSFTIDVRGKGGHGAMPHSTVDAIVESAALVTSLQTIVSRNKNPLETGVLTCGTINGGYAHNVIADCVCISGTCRTFNKDIQEMMRSRMTDICGGVAQTYGGEINLNYQYGYPATVNTSEKCVQDVIEATAKIVGRENTAQPLTTMGAEDFSYFLLNRPGCFFFVGAQLPGELRPHHKSVFDFDERAQLISASAFVQIVRDLLFDQ